MKILIISHEYPPVGGGGANACSALAHEFAEAGNTVLVLTAGYRGTPAHESLAGGNLRITRVDAKRRYRDHCSAPEMMDYVMKASAEADDVLKRERYDVCLCFFGIPGGILARRLRKKYGLRYIIRMGGGDIPGFQNRFRRLYRLSEPELRRIWRDADALVANSEGLRETALGFCDRYPVRVITNGVDTDVYTPSDERRTDDGPVRLLTVCRLIERKGIQDVIPEIRNIEKRTGRSIRWVIAGDGPYRQTLEELARDSGAEGCMEFRGLVEKGDMSELYRQADIFVLPSYREGMPNAVLEAMASGLPVIMREGCQGADELIRDNGIAARGSFADALAELIGAGRDRWREMGCYGRQMVLGSYMWERIAGQYTDLLELAAGISAEKTGEKRKDV